MQIKTHRPIFSIDSELLLFYRWIYWRQDHPIKFNGKLFYRLRSLLPVSWRHQSDWVKDIYPTVDFSISMLSFHPFQVFPFCETSFEIFLLATTGTTMKMFTELCLLNFRKLFLPSSFHFQPFLWPFISHDWSLLEIEFFPFLLKAFNETNMNTNEGREVALSEPIHAVNSDALEIMKTQSTFADVFLFSLRPQCILEEKHPHTVATTFFPFTKSNFNQKWIID